MSAIEWPSATSPKCGFLRDLGTVDTQFFPQKEVKLVDVTPLSNSSEQIRKLTSAAMSGRIANPSKIDLIKLPKNSIVFGRDSWVAAASGKFIYEQILPEFRATPQQILTNIRIPDFDGNTVGQSDASEDPIVKVEQETVLIARYGDGTWGHWLIELLPKIILAEHFYPNKFSYAVPAWVLQPGAGILRERIIETLVFYGIKAERIVQLEHNHNYVFSNLFDVEPVFTDYILHPDVMKLINQKTPDNVVGNFEKVALFRGGSPHRQISNSLQVMEILRSAGFEIIDIALKTFAEQVSIFQSAKHIFSILGSGLSGLVYSRDDVSVIAAAPENFTDRFFSGLLQLKDRPKYAEVRGKPAGDDTDESFYRDRAFEVPLDFLNEVLTTTGARA